MIPFLGYVDSIIHRINLRQLYCGKNLLPVLNMDRKRIDAIERSFDEGFIDLKINIERLSNFVAVEIIDNRDTAKEVKELVEDVRYASYQTSWHDSRIDDNEMNLKEMMGKIDLIQEDL